MHPARYDSKAVCWRHRSLEGEVIGFDVKTFRKLLGVGVYIIFGSKEALYVGMGKNMLSRISTPEHEAVRKALSEEVVSVEFILAKGEAHAKQLEADFIRLYQPKHNLAGKGTEFQRMQIFESDFREEFEKRLG